MTLTQDLVRQVGSRDEFEACRQIVHKYFGHYLKRGEAADVKRIAAAVGIDVEYVRETPYEGCIERDGFGRARVRIRSGLNKRRERFTLAHELGHWALQEQMLGTCEGKLFRGISVNDQEMREEESLANLIAAEILLPRESVASCFRSDAIHESLNRICREHVVSRTMALRRVSDVTEHNIAVLQIMPYEFDDFGSRAQIDDAMFATSRSGTLFARESTTLCQRIRYRDLLKGRRHRIEILCPKGFIASEFECLHRDTPAPHCYCISLVESWQR